MPADAKGHSALAHRRPLCRRGVFPLLLGRPASRYEVLPETFCLFTCRIESPQRRVARLHGLQDVLRFLPLADPRRGDEFREALAA